MENLKEQQLAGVPKEIKDNIIEAAQEPNMLGETAPGFKFGVFFVPFKYIALVLLMVQTTAVVLATRFSRTQEGGRYLTTTAVAMAEVFKIAGSFVLLCVERREKESVIDVAKYLVKEYTENTKDVLKLAVPAGLYTVQNNLLFIALSNLDAATYQVTYQLKILTTAIFSVFLLSKVLKANQWMGLVMLFCGVALVQMPTSDAPVVKEGQSPFIGLVAILTACCSSGFAGVYFEMILKGSKQSVWLRNIELGLFGAILGIAGCYMKDGPKIAEAGFFQHYNSLTWVVISLYAFGGLVVAAVIKYADNILKTFANALSILITGVISYLLFGDTELSWNFVCGALLVVCATFLYRLYEILIFLLHLHGVVNPLLPHQLPFPKPNLKKLD